MFIAPRIRSPPKCPSLARRANRRGRSLCLLLVAAELEAHRGQELVGELGLAARLEAAEQGGAQHGSGNRFVDRGLQRPATFAGVADPAGESFEVRALEQ